MPCILYLINEIKGCEENKEKNTKMEATRMNVLNLRGANKWNLWIFSEKMRS